MLHTFSAEIEIIGVNPYVEVPSDILNALQNESKKTSAIPVKGTLNGKPYTQTVMKYSGLWRLYLNTPMRSATKTHVGDTVKVEIEYDPADRSVPIPKDFAEALSKNPAAKTAFEKMSPSHQKEYNRYLGSLKSEDAKKRNIEKAIAHLTGKKINGVIFR
jgi:hypothetical protein